MAWPTILREDGGSWEQTHKRLEALIKTNGNKKLEDSIQPKADNMLDFAVYKAASQDNIDMFITVLEKFSADNALSLSEIIERTTPSGDSLLHIAASSRNEDIAKHIAYLFPHLISRENVKGDTALHVAARAGMLNTVKSLVSGTSPSSSTSNCGGTMEQLLRIKNACGNTALHEAVLNLRLDVVEFLISTGPVWYLQNKEGWSPLYMAVKIGDEKIFLSLLKASAGLGDSLERLEGSSPMHAAIMENRLYMLEEMAKKNLEYLRLRDGKGRTPLHWAAHRGNLPAISTIIRYSRETNFERDERDFLPIHIASEKGKVDVIEELLKSWPDPVHLLTAQSQNILHVAAESGKDNVVKYILGNSKMEKLLNEKDKNGDTPLHLAAKYCHPGVVLTLTWDKRIEKDLLNSESLTPLDVHFKSIGDSIFIDLPKMQQVLTFDALSSAGCCPSSDIEIKHKKKPIEKRVRKIEWLKDSVGTLLTVATLVATGAFTAGFTAPGGYNSSDDPDKGIATLLNDRVFQIFTICNSAAFYFSIASIICCFYTMFGDLNLASRAYDLAQKIFGIAVFLMSLAFLAAIHISVSKLSWLASITLIMGIFCVLLVCLDSSTVLVPIHRSHPLIRYPSYCIIRAAIFVFLWHYDQYLTDEEPQELKHISETETKDEEKQADPSSIRDNKKD